ncbi:MAG TPA: hypothetical protein VN805_08705 [Caulobacteraceae bacterium]|nr:hypothetical protein [Caulobacteraceae bacterium]
MMALRNSPSEYALIHALDGGTANRPPSKALAIAIGVSVAFHLGLVTYLTLERMGAELPPASADQATTMSLVQLPPPRPTHATTEPPRQAVAVHNTALSPLQPPATINTLKPTPTVVTTGRWRT